AVEVILALAARGDDPAVTEQGQVMTDGRLALAELRAEGADVLLPLGQDQDHLEAGRVADVLQEDRGALGVLEPLVGPLLGPGPAGRLGGGRGLHASLGGHPKTTSSLKNLSGCQSMRKDHWTGHIPAAGPSESRT